MAALEIRRRKPLLRQGDTGAAAGTASRHRAKSPFAIAIDDLRATDPDSQIANRRLPMAESPARTAVLRPHSACFLLPAAFALISVARRLQQIRLVGRHAAEGVAGADLGDGAFVAVHAAVVPHLQEERAVAEAVAALDALGAADAEPLVNRVFVIGVLDVGALDGGGGAEAVLRAGVQVVRLRLESSRCKAGSSRRWRRRGRTSRRTARARSAWRNCRSARTSAGSICQTVPLAVLRPATTPSRPPKPVSAAARARRAGTGAGHGAGWSWIRPVVTIGQPPICHLGSPA